MYIIAQYTYIHGDTFNEILVNEKAIFLKSAITHIGIGYDSDIDVYFIAFKGLGIDTYINLESADIASDILGKVQAWWLENRA